MATMRRETKRKINRYKLIKFEAYLVLIGLVIVGGIGGFFIGKSQAKVKTETVTVYEKVDNPVEYEKGELPKPELHKYYSVPLSHSLQDYIYEVCEDEKVPTSLVIAMIEKESSFDPEIVSSTNDYGLMQINSINTDWFAEVYKSADLLNPYQNVYCGILTIGKYLRDYDNDYSKALMCYNMGEYGAKKAWSNGITSTDYSKAIISLMGEYEQEVSSNEGNK